MSPIPSQSRHTKEDCKIYHEKAETLFVVSSIVNIFNLFFAKY